MTLWVKLWVDILDDPKLMSATRRGASHLCWLPWLIAYAKRADDDGCLTIGGQPAEPVDIARSIPNATANRIRLALAELENIGVLDRRTDSALHFSAWNVRAMAKPSDSPEESARRVREFRERKRKRNNTDGNDGNALQGVTGNADVTRQRQTKSESESESETQTEIEAASLARLPASARELLTTVADAYRMGALREMLEYIARGPGTGPEAYRRLGEECAATLAAIDDSKEIRAPWPYTKAALNAAGTRTQNGRRRRGKPSSAGEASYAAGRAAFSEEGA